MRRAFGMLVMMVFTGDVQARGGAESAADSAGGPGFAVDVFPSSEAAPRNSEGSIIAWSDGRLLLAVTRFYGGRADDAKAHIAAVTSRDGVGPGPSRSCCRSNVGK